MSEQFASTEDRRTENNTFRHQYRTLTEAEKAYIQQIKDMALQMYGTMSDIGDSRELSIAKNKLEESVMWAVKHITG